MSWQNPCRLDVEGPGLHCPCWWLGDPCCGCHEQMQPPGPRRMHGPACNPRPPLRALLRHLIEAHCPEGWEPECFIVGPRAYAVEQLHRDAAALGYPLICCRHPSCDPSHVSLITRAVRLLPAGVE